MWLLPHAAQETSGADGAKGKRATGQAASGSVAGHLPPDPLRARRSLRGLEGGRPTLGEALAAWSRCHGGQHGPTWGLQGRPEERSEGLAEDDAGRVGGPTLPDLL